MKQFLQKITTAFLATVLLLGTCAGCARRPAQKASFHIMASFYPVYIMSINITNGIQGVQVDNMAGQQTGCLHDYQLQSADMQALSQANLFIINGAGMESFMSRVTDQLPHLTVLDSSTGVSHITDKTGEVNPHLWVSISNYMQQVQNITAGLEKADPPHAAQYRANADIYLKKLRTLRTRMHTELDHLPHRDIITFHEAFPYFAKEFHLNIVQTVQREPDSQPSAKELAETIRMIRQSGVKAVFAEPQYEQSAAQIIAQESGAAFYKLDPAVTGSYDRDAYLKAMEKNTQTLQKALA
ncbi:MULTISPECIES: metal ABC transporter substrate-binding protein [Caproicibacterium]|jgi:zinc transport system substrate-binding protein|uniref:Zinc ABC transporter substrate-binding protein n=1 Tax=Caproicibacterium lactatifermentans TaxID=2666138 RepID=A0A859DN85_9FIRM|nr:metal ABC transporter substrate-binding protein [Caproicibacterium lactatifermentans]ARP50816.1 zinc ABC transporter substrate-binding protein [Ruminococcaceae bacterium CPB6]QKN23457.1 zinc ABC transporter substrate-binding protein [Caproicibacterium lactatifermentans]QKO29866.1 zinc ABC transporter substrate-binding protein [Caproicibacterium lactatifermentans]